MFHENDDAANEPEEWKDSEPMAYDGPRYELREVLLSGISVTLLVDTISGDTWYLNLERGGWIPIKALRSPK